jgi:hypothetical protein
MGRRGAVVGDSSLASLTGLTCKVVVLPKVPDAVVGQPSVYS